MSLFKSLYVNLHYFPIKTALHLPILVGAQVRLNELGGRIEVGLIRRGIVRFSIVSGSFCVESTSGFLHIGQNASLRFDGQADFAKGSALIVDGNCQIGGNLYCNANGIINANKEITIGENCLIGWNVTIIDGDGHSIYPKTPLDDVEPAPINESRPITIGNNVWLAANTSILKGAVIANDSILATGSILTHRIDETHVVIAGNPARIVKRGVSWKV